MQEITFEIDAHRAGRANGFLGGLTVERYTFTGATLPTGTRLAILTRAGNTIAAAEIAEGNAAEVDTNTQEVADLLRYQPLCTCETVYITLGDADNILAIIPATMRKNWLDDEATHPPVPANRYPTKTELDQWLARFDDRASATAAAQSAAEASASASAKSATEASNSADNARLSAKVANDSATEADEYKRSAETAQSKAEAAQRAAENAASAASGSATEAKDAATNADKSATAAQTASTTAQNAANAANNSATAADEHKRSAQSADESAHNSENAASDSAAAANEHATAAQNAANAASNSASAAKSSETSAAESATSASDSATAAKASANAALNSAMAASSSADAAASSAAAAKQSATDLAEAVETAERLDGRLVDVENGLVTVRSTYLPLTGGTVKGTLSVDTSSVIDRPALDLKIHTNQDDPARSLIVIRDETGTEFASIKAKRAEKAAAYKGQIYISSEFLSTKLLNTSAGFFGSYGVAPTTGKWVDAGGAWKFDLIKGEIAITNNGWNSDENAMPASTTFLKFTDIATTEKIDAATEKIDAATEKILNGKGAYVIQSRDVVHHGIPTSSDVGKVIYFDGVDAETTSTLKVMNRVPFAQKVCPAPIASSSPSMCAVGCFDYVRNKKYIVFMTSLSITPIGYLYQLNVSTYSSTLTFKSKLHTSHFRDQSVGAAYWCRNICVHDGFVFYTWRHSKGGPGLTVCDVETGSRVVELDLDPKDAGGIYVNSAIWYNPLSGHICVLSYAHSLATGETWGGNSVSYNNTHFVRVFSWDSETKTLSDIPDGDSPVTIIDVTDAFTEAGVTGVRNDGAYGSTWPIRDQVFVSIKGPSYTALFHATADDRIEPCYEWDVEYETDESGITRPVWETQPEEWTDADGNTRVIQNYVRNNRWDYALVPKMTKGRLLKFMCAATYEGVPSETWCANPVFYHNVFSFCESYENAAEGFKPQWGGTPQSFVKLTDGVKRWIVMDGNKLVDINAFNTLTHLKSPPNPDANGKPLEEWIPRDAETGVYLIGDIRKGGTQKFTGWLPKSGNYLASIGSVTGSHTHEISCITQLTAAQSGTPLSRLGMVKNIGQDSAVMTPLPMTTTYSADWWIASMLPYCKYGFFGNVWMTTYN